jgi:Gly-Xaa carboxypeptidase
MISSSKSSSHPSIYLTYKLHQLRIPKTVTMAKKNKTEKIKESLLPKSQGENEPLLSSGKADNGSSDNISSWLWGWHIPCTVVFVFLMVCVLSQGKREVDRDHRSDAQDPLLGGSACPQFPPLEASSNERKNFMDDLKNEITSNAFFNASTKRMQGAIQIPTESFDDMGEVGEDKRWEALVPFQKYLNETFPLV